MAGLLKLKSMFFDRDNIAKMLSRKSARTLSRFGAATRGFAQKSMRSRKGKSAPGQPPFAHDKRLLRKLLFFAFDGGKSVVVGPVLKSSTSGLGIPKTHERGGVIVGRAKDGTPSTSRYPARPYMGPAGAKYLPKLKDWYASA